MSANFDCVQAFRDLSSVLALNKNMGSSNTVRDSVMAAPAIVKGASLVTPNVKDFKNLKIEIVNTFSNE